MMLINLTPHRVVLKENMREQVIPSRGCARVRQKNWRFVTHADGWPVVEPVGQFIEGLPGPQPGVTYIVSAIVLNNLPPDRLDCVALDTYQGQVERDHKGVIVSVPGFVAKNRKAVS